MSYTYSLSTNVGKVRLWIGDTTQATADFSDEEISEILSQNADDVKQSAVSLLLILANDKAKLAKRKSAGKYSEDLSQIAKELREQAKALLELGEVPHDAVVEQTFGPLDKPYDGEQEKEFIERENLRDS